MPTGVLECCRRNPASGDLTVSGLTFTRGKIESTFRGGAGILFESDGTALLTVRNSTVTDNSAGLQDGG